MLDRLTIRQLVEDWAVLRDARMWERFRGVWHEDGRMMATWFQGTRDEFIKVSEEGYAEGRAHPAFPRRLDHRCFRHARDRADQDDDLAARQGRRRAVRRGVHRAVLRFLREARDRWGLVLRQPIYEKDRLDPLDPSAKLALDQELLARFPEGYRHLAYLQTRIGYTVKPDMPGLDGPEVAALYARGEKWLQGEKL